MINEFETMELVKHILDMEDEEDFIKVEDQLWNDFNISFDDFRSIADRLIMLTMPQERNDELHYCFFDVNLEKGWARSIARVVEDK